MANIIFISFLLYKQHTMQFTPAAFIRSRFFVQSTPRDTLALLNNETTPKLPTMVSLRHPFQRTWILLPPCTSLACIGCPFPWPPVLSTPRVVYLSESFVRGHIQFPPLCPLDGRRGPVRLCRTIKQSLWPEG